MTQAEFQLTSKAPSQCDLILAELIRWRGAWVPMPHLVKVSGAYAVHSRVSDLRKRGYPVEQQNDRRKDGTVLSAYRIGV